MSGKKTGGFRSRMIPVKGKIVMAFGNNDKRQELHEIGKDQAENVKNFRRILGHAFVNIKVKINGVAIIDA